MHDRLPGDWSFAVWENLITTIVFGAAMTFALFSSFRILERQQVVICGIVVLGTIVASIVVTPDLGNLIVGAVSFGHLPTAPDWAPPAARNDYVLNLVAVFGYVGGSLSGYLAYSSWVGQSGWGINSHPQIDEIRRRASASRRIDYLPDDPEQVSRLKKLLTPLRWDVGLGAIVLFIVTGAFMLSGASVLYPLQTRFEGWSLLTNQAHVWSNIHESLVWVYYICIIAALWGTLQALPEIYARVTQEFFQAVWPKREWNYDKIRRRICLYIFCVALVIVWLNLPFNILIQIAGFILANLSIAIIMLAALYLNFKLPAPYRTRLPMLIGAILSTGVLIIFASISGWGLAGKFFGSG